MLSPPSHHALHGKKQEIVHFRTDLSSVGLPPDLIERLSVARQMVHSSSGPDLKSTAIGPAIGMAVGPGSYMDLVYGGPAPGRYPDKDHRLGGTIFQRQHDGTNVAVGGRGRTWAEWATLWRDIADWVYEHDAAWLEMGVLGSPGYKYSLSPEERQKLHPGQKVPREFLATEAIDAADAVHAVFAQLAERPLSFQGIEWGFLELEIPVQVSDSFYARFGRRPGRDHLSKLVEDGEWYRPDYTLVDKKALKVCPRGYQGADWEAWLLSIEGGDVVVTETLFQVRVERVPRLAVNSTTVLTVDLGSVVRDTFDPASSKHQDYRERETGSSISRPTEYIHIIPFSLSIILFSTERSRFPRQVVVSMRLFGKVNLDGLVISSRMKLMVLICSSLILSLG